MVICASSATDKSRTAKLMAGRKDSLVAMFWPPDLASVAGEVRMMADAAGLRLGGDLAERIARGAGLDVRLARSEIDKLALYLDASTQAPRLADHAALEAIGATTEEDGIAPIVSAVLSGALERLPGELRRMREVGINPVAVTLALERRTAQIARLAARLGRGGDVKAALDAERVFFRERERIDRPAATLECPPARATGRAAGRACTAPCWGTRPWPRWFSPKPWCRSRALPLHVLHEGLRLSFGLVQFQDFNQISSNVA